MITQRLYSSYSCDRKHDEKMNIQVRQSDSQKKIAILDKKLSFEKFSSVNVNKRPRFELMIYGLQARYMYNNH